MATKQIVSKSEIKDDPKLQIVKAYRLLNKTVGELKTEYAEADGNETTQEEINTKIESACAKMRTLSKKAEAADFHLWVNEDGKTGHTYEKDYKVTSPASNDYEAHQALMEERRNAIDAMIAGLPEDDSSDNDSLN